MILNETKWPNVGLVCDYLHEYRLLSALLEAALTDYAFVLPQHKTGLPISTYFSAVKLRWLMDNVDEVRDAVKSHRAMFGTVDSWLIWVRKYLVFAYYWYQHILEKH